MTHRSRLRDTTAEGHANNVCPLYLQCIHKRDDIVCEIVNRVGNLIVGAKT